MPPHPLKPLSIEETLTARNVIRNAYPEKVKIFFRSIYAQEPPKDELVTFLELEHSGRLTDSTPRPARLAKCQYDVIDSEKVPVFHDDVVNVETKEIVHSEEVGGEFHAALTM